ncbi:MAG TPA: CvpA family protein [Chitinophagaceae bacterium]|nr:CvpA family protein [Chitinophagaceae bacterium]
MAIDGIYILLMAIALIKGLKNGLISAIFSIIAFVIALVFALKLSALVASWLTETTDIPAKWLPIISFLLVFIIVASIIHAAGVAIENTINWAFLGWVNKLGGIAVYAVTYTIVYSVILFYAEKTDFVSDETINTSACYSFIQPWGPTVINGIAAVIPWFKNMFEELQDYFKKIAVRLKH